MLESIRQDTQRKRLYPGECLVAGRSIDHGSREPEDLGDPAAIFLAIDLDAQFGRFHVFAIS